MNQIVKLIRQVVDSYMESFETAFPAVVKKVNSDGTVDVTPSIRNVLKNMQIEPDGSDGKPLPIEGVPVLWPGTSAAVASPICWASCFGTICCRRESFRSRFFIWSWI